MGIILLLSIAAGCSRAPKPPAPPANPANLSTLTGDYIVNGFDPTGIEYGGRLKITPGPQPGEYLLEWIISGDLQSGRGVVEGNQLKVAWQSLPIPGRPPRQGTTLYTITSAGELTGVRHVDGYAKEGRETAYPNTPENMK